MLIITLMDNGSILLSSVEILNMLDNPESYLQVKVDSTINCCPQIYSHTKTSPFTSNTYFDFTSEGIEVKPAFFDVVSPNSIIDGVYYFNVKIFTTENNYTYQTNCTFIDITMKCAVAKYIDTLNNITEDGAIATNVHILHYALVNGSNCGCNCIAMCDAFKQLYDILKPITPQLQGCGC
jgi:hypothetical protein